jgi:hypothetical protein
MHSRSATPSSAEIAGEANTLFAGLGIFTLTFLPLAVPGLVLVVAPLAVVAVVGLVLAVPFVLPVWLARVVWKRRSPSAKGSLDDRGHAVVEPPRGRANRMRVPLRIR